MMYDLPEDFQEQHEELHKLIFMTCLRLATHKEDKVLVNINLHPCNQFEKLEDGGTTINMSECLSVSPFFCSSVDNWLRRAFKSHCVASRFQCQIVHMTHLRSSNSWPGCCI